MANASGFFTPLVPNLRRRIQPPKGIFRSGSYSPGGFSTRVFCSNTTEGADKLASGASSSESRVPRYVSFFFFFNFFCILVIDCAIHP